MKRRYVLGLATGLLAATLAVTGCNPVTQGPGGWVNGFSSGGKAAPASTAPAQPGNPCPGGNGFKTINDEWNCDGTLVP